jgi:thioredoxin 1
MKRFTFLALAALFVPVLFVGCAEPTAEPTTTTETPEASVSTADGHDHDELVSEVDKAGLTQALDDNTVTFVDFTATWCGPCQKLKPKLHEMAEEFEGKVKFVEVDVDKSKDLATEYGIQAMPTLIVMKDGKEESRIVGGDVAAIRQAIEKAL